MAEDAWQPFADAIARGDAASVVERFEALEEKERKRLSARAKGAAKALVDGDRWPTNLRGADAERRRARANAADAAVFGSGGSAAAARSWWVSWGDSGLRERLVRCRPREWRQDWAERAMSGDEIRNGDWKIVHAMVSDGSIERPAAAGYLTGAVGGMYEWSEADDGSLHIRRPLAATLRDEQEWLRNDLWRLFEVEEAAIGSRDSWHPHGVQTWPDALRELAADGTISRDRLLDETLAALRRDFSAHNSRWYHKLYEALEPTPEEQLARLDELLALLAAGDPAVVGFALRALDRLERKRPLPVDRLLEAIPPALLLPVKGHASRAVKLTARALKRDPSFAPIAAPVLVQALAHESRDVQELVLDLLERHSDALGDADREQLAAAAADVDPAVRSRAEAIAGAAAIDGGALPVSAGPAVAVPGRRPPDPGRPRLTGSPLAPPADVEELLDRIAVALERDDDPDELELLLDGISRLRDARVDPGRARAVVERALGLSPVWEGQVGFNRARDALSVAILRWLGGRGYRKVQLGRTGRSPREAIAVRVRELVDDLPGGKPRRMLCAPTHTGGWIDPGEAVRRVAGDRTTVMDLAQMVLRLAPDRRDEARAASSALKGEAAAVLNYALGGEPKRPFRSRLKLAWVAAEQARDPARHELPRRRPDDHASMRASWFRLEVPKVEPASPADLLVLEESWWGWEPSGIERWLTIVWPANREGIFDVVVRRLWINTGTREYGIGDVLEVLLDPAEPIGDQAALAVALALGSADITDRALGTDVAIAALDTRRLDGETLGAKLVLMLRRQEPAVPSRWAVTLADVAAAGPLAAHDVQIAIEKVLAMAHDDDRRRLLGLVDLLRRLAVEADAAVENPRARDWLASLSASSKIGRAGREALSVSGDGAARSRAAAAQAGA